MPQCLRRRFAGNPWSIVSNGGEFYTTSSSPFLIPVVKGYVGVPITLEIDPSNPHSSERVTVGVLALMSNKPFPRLTDTQLKVLDDLCTMLSVQLRSTWEGWRRGKEARLRNAVSMFLQTALVEPSQQAMSASVAMAGPHVQGSGSGTNTPRNVEAISATAALFANAAQQLHELLEADFAIIIDLTSFHATKVSRCGHGQTSVKLTRASTQGSWPAATNEQLHDRYSTSGAEKGAIV
jgi:hypothetical protein